MRENNTQTTYERPSFIDWLKQEKGITKIFEDTRTNIKERKNTALTYFFKSQEDLEKFSQENNNIIKIGYDDTLGHYAIISSQIHSNLKEKYLKNYPPLENLQKIDEQLELIKLAKTKLHEFNTLSIEESRSREKNQDPFRFKAFDKVGMMAQMLRNKSEGWVQDVATAAIDMVQTTYQALNYNFLSTEENDNMYRIRELINGKEENNHQLASYKLEVLFKLSLNNTQTPLIKENIEDLLNGGFRKIPVRDRVKFSLRAKSSDVNSYYQPRFIPDEEGKSETDIIIMHAGSMPDHSAMRILRKEADENTPGGFRYYYTKTDAGGGREVNEENKKIYGIYTTEVKPIFKRIPSGNYVRLGEDELEKIKNDPKIYKQYLQDTLQILLESERRLEFYNPLRYATIHTKALIKEGQQWDTLEEIIKLARGNKVEDRCEITHHQIIGNCTVYSPFMLMAGLSNSNIAYSMMDEAKKYNHHDLLWKLEKKEKELIKQKLEFTKKTSPSFDINNHTNTTLINAINDGQLWNGKEVLVYLLDINQKINGQHPIEYAALNGGKINNKDPLLYAVENNIKIEGMHPLIWAVVNNKNNPEHIINIEGKPPIVWALQNPDKSIVEGKSFIRYLQIYEIDKKSNIKSIIINEKLDILSTLVAEYDVLKNTRPINPIDITTLENFYDELIGKLAIKEKDSPNNLSKFESLLQKHSSSELARKMLSSSGEAEVSHRDKLNSNLFTVDTIMQNLPLSAVHKIMKIGNELQQRENPSIITSIKDAIATFVDKVKSLFKSNNLTKELLEGFNDLAVQATNTISTGAGSADKNVQEKKSMLEKVIANIQPPSHINR